MTHAAEYVDGIRAALKAIYPAVPACLIVGDEPAGDFGIAHTGGRNAIGCVWMTYDIGSLPSYHTAVHEIGHSINAMFAPEIGLWEDAQCVRDFWALRAFPLSITQADAESLGFGARGYQFAAWQRIPVEVFAEEFAAMVTQDGRCMTYNWGVPRDDNALRQFFSALGREAGMAVSEADLAAYKVALQAQLEAADARTLNAISEVSRRIGELEQIVRQLVQKYPLG